MSHPLEPYFGKYLGLSPTDESPIMAGEIEVIIDETGLRGRHATGLKLDENRPIPLSEIHQLTEDEIAEHYPPDSDCFQDIDGFCCGDNGAVLLFNRKATVSEPVLFVQLDECADMLGPTILFGSKQLEAGTFDRLVEKIKKEYGEFSFPRLEYGGLLQPAT